MPDVEPNNFTLGQGIIAQGHDDQDGDLTDGGASEFANPACPRCHGAGVYMINDGRAADRTLLCPCVPEGRKRAAADMRIEMIFGQAGRKMTIAGYDPGSSEENQLALKVAKNYVLDFPAFRAQGKGFALQGLPGSGKTHLATGVCAALVKKYDIKPFALSVPEMLRLARKRFDDPSTADVLGQAQKADIYLLDDIGAEYHRNGVEGMSWVDEQLFLILDARLKEGLPTIYTTNLSKRELAQRVDDRVLRRLDTGCMAFLPMVTVPRATAHDKDLMKRLLADR